MHERSGCIIQHAAVVTVYVLMIIRGRASYVDIWLDVIWVVWQLRTQATQRLVAPGWPMLTETVRSLNRAEPRLLHQVRGQHSLRLS